MDAYIVVGKKFALGPLRVIGRALFHRQPHIGLGDFARIKIVKRFHRHALVFAQLHFHHRVARFFQSVQTRRAHKMPQRHFDVFGVRRPVPFELTAAFIKLALQRVRHTDLPMQRFFVGLEFKERVPISHRVIQSTGLEMAATAQLIHVSESGVVRNGDGIILHRAFIEAEDIEQLRALDVSKTIGHIHAHRAIHQLEHGVGVARLQGVDSLQEKLLLFHLGKCHRLLVALTILARLELLRRHS